MHFLTMQTSLRQFACITMTFFLILWSVLTAQGYAFNEIVPHVRQPGSVSGGSACPVAYAMTRSLIFSRTHAKLSSFIEKLSKSGAGLSQSIA